MIPNCQVASNLILLEFTNIREPIAALVNLDHFDDNDECVSGR
jgi:hypothetical protein